MEYAGFWIRFGAYLIDSIILWIVQTIILSVFGLGIGAAESMDTSGTDAIAGGLSLVVILVTLGISVAYFVVLESGPWQATLGKKALGLIVTDERGERISWLRALGRYLAKILSGLILMIGYIMAAFTEKRQGLHDLLASTLVLKAQPGQVGTDGVFD